jgi:hypothetical protein
MVEGNITEGANKDMTGDDYPSSSSDSESAPFNRHISVKDHEEEEEEEEEEELYGPENVAKILTVASISKLASSTGITRGELEDLRAKVPIEAFKLLMLSKGTSDKSPSVSTTAG